MISFIDQLAPTRIVIFRALQLGDMLCSVPALRALRQAAPNAHIALIGLPWAQAFVDRFSSLLDELIVFPGAVGFPEQREDDSALLPFIKAMHARCFDLAIQLHGSGGAANDIVCAFGAKTNAGFIQPDECQRRGYFIGWPDHLPEPHRYLTLMHAMGVPIESDKLSFDLTVRDEADYASLVTTHGIEIHRLILIHPGAQLPSRRWPVARFAAVADALSSDGWQVAVTGIACEAELTASLISLMSMRALHLAGATSLGSLAALVKYARLVVCNDTGISHIAAAMRTPSVVIASGSDISRWAPLDHELHHVLADYPICRPCAYPVCPYDHACALNITVGEVVQRTRTVLARTSDRRSPLPYPLSQPTYPVIRHVA